MKNVKKITKIKVIKKNDIGVIKTSEVQIKNPLKVKKRAMVSTIKEWVNDLQKRQLKDAKDAVDNIYIQKPQNA